MMATDAQILANRLNALSSTGPVSLAGKIRIRLNAIRPRPEHFVTDLEIAQAYERITGNALGLREEVDFEAFTLARADAVLDRARREEFDLMKSGHDGLRRMPERRVLAEYIMGLMEKVEDDPKINPFQLVEVYERYAKKADREARKTYRRLLADLALAEREHAEALARWVAKQ